MTWDDQLTYSRKISPERIKLKSKKRVETVAVEMSELLSESIQETIGEESQQKQLQPVTPVKHLKRTQIKQILQGILLDHEE